MMLALGKIALIFLVSVFVVAFLVFAVYHIFKGDEHD